MRIKNKEIRARRHRKEQKVKMASRELRATYGDAKATQAEKPSAPKRASATTKKTADAAPKAAPKKAQPKAE